MCNWCNKETKGRPQVSGVKVPMICEHCGTHVGWIGWAELIKWKRGTLVLPKCKGACNE